MCQYLFKGEFFMNFNQRLKQSRQSVNLTQKQVAEHLGMTPNAYQKYELGTLEPNLSKLVQLSNLFHVSIDYLLGCSNEPTRH